VGKRGANSAARRRYSGGIEQDSSVPCHGWTCLAGRTGTGTGECRSGLGGDGPSSSSLLNVSGRVLMRRSARAGLGGSVGC
jgi:hypothetical protein